MGEMRPGSMSSAQHRDAVLASAYDLMSRYGVREVTLERVAEHSGVALDDIVAEFPTNEELAAAFLAKRERDWTIGFVEAGARMRGTTPIGRLLAIFDVFDDWFHRDDYDACSFINVLLEMGREHPLGVASREYLANIREMVAALAREADLEHPDEFARSWHILMKGSIISAVEGDLDAARRAQAMARDLIARHTRRDDSLIDDFDLEVFATGPVRVPVAVPADDGSFDWESSAYLDWNEV